MVVGLADPLHTARYVLFFLYLTLRLQEGRLSEADPTPVSSI